jgi:hypothetical protein
MLESVEVVYFDIISTTSLISQKSLPKLFGDTLEEKLEFLISRVAVSSDEFEVIAPPIPPVQVHDEKLSPVNYICTYTYITRILYTLNKLLKENSALAPMNTAPPPPFDAVKLDRMDEFIITKTETT